MKRPLRLTIELILAAAFFITLAGGWLLWRIQTEPLHIDQLTPEIQSILKDAAPDINFKINNALLTSDQDDAIFKIVLHDVVVTNNDDQKIGSVQAMILGFSLKNLITLNLVPSKLIVKGPSFQVVRFEDGHIGLNTNSTTPPQKSSTRGLERFLAGSDGTFQRVRIENAWIQFEDRKDPATFEVKDGSFIFARAGDHMQGSLNLELSSNKFKQKVSGTIGYDEQKHVTTISVGTRAINLTELGKLLPEIPEGLELSTPVTAVTQIMIDNEWKPRTLTVDLRGQKGTLLYPPYFPDKASINDLLLRVSYDLFTRSLAIENLDIALDQGHATAKGLITNLNQPDKDKTITLQAQATDIPVDALKIYWPHEVGTHARDWVTKNLSKGVAAMATLDMQALLKTNKNFTIQKMVGTIDFKDTRVEYLHPMPAVENVSGQATYDATNFNIKINQGTILATKLKKADLRISNIHNDDTRIDMLLHLKGPLRDAIEIISSEPLKYPQKMGFTPDQFAGTATNTLYLGFPLLHDLKLEQVAMKNAALLKNITVKNVVRDITATAEKMVLKADTEMLTLSGNARLVDAPLHVTWNEFFGNAKNTTKLDLDGMFTPGLLKGLRFDSTAYLNGSARGKVKLVQDKERNIAISADTDATNMQITVDEAGISKPSGMPAKVNFDLSIEAKGPTTLSNASATWRDFAIKDAMARWNKTGALESATLKNVKAGRTNASLVVTPIADNQLRIVMNGPSIDVSGFWSDKDDKDKEKKSSDTRYDINLRGNKVFLDPTVPFSDLRADVSVKGHKILAMNISGKVEDATFSAQQSKVKDGSQLLDIRATVTGKILQALNITDSVRGGTLVITGQSTPQAPLVINAKADMTGFTMVKAPVLARLINALSPVGLLDLLNGSGLSFDDASSDVTLEDDGTIRLRKGRLSGASLGMNFSGRVYPQNDTINIKGTLIPMEGINKIASKIPLIGQILTGIKGEGILAATYQIKGDTSDPSVTVNPLSALAPGILRSIFFESDDD